MTTAIDPITVEVIHNYLLSAAKEMERNLMRTAYNTVIYEIRDFGLSIHDDQCRLLAEAAGLAIFTRGNDYGLQKSVEFLGKENINPGDIILTSYPYWSAAHPLDVLAITPIFYRDELMGFTAIKQHWIDLGQRDPGYVLDSTDVFQEGLLLPAVKIYNKGVLNRELMDILRFNTRWPDRVIGDMNAQISASRTGERRVVEMLEKFGPETYRSAVDEILDHGERIARARLAELPKGTWSAEDFMDDDGIDKDTLIKLKCTVTITNDEFIVDWTGSHPPTKGPMNMPFGETQGVSTLAFKGITTPDTPANDGNFRPVKVIAPESEFLNAVPPRPTFTGWAGLMIPEVILKTLSQVLPDRIPACSGGDIYGLMGLGTHPETGRAWMESNNEPVGYGAHAGHDGEDGIMHLSEPGCRNNPVEVAETKAPWIIENYHFRSDSGGAGEFRGGCGVTRTYRFLADSTCLFIAKKTKIPPWGMAGGYEGEAGFLLTNLGHDETRHGAVTVEPAAEDRLSNNSGGGGGWGHPFKRDPQRVLWDLMNGYVSIERARTDYGVVIDPVTMTVDDVATDTIRNGSTR